MAADPEANKLVREIVALNTSAGVGRSNLETAARSADPEVRREAQDRLKRMDANARAKVAKEENVSKQLAKLSSKYHPGCLASALPADLSAALEQRH